MKINRNSDHYCEFIFSYFHYSFYHNLSPNYSRQCSIELCSLYSGIFKYCHIFFLYIPQKFERTLFHTVHMIPICSNAGKFISSIYIHIYINSSRNHPGQMLEPLWWENSNWFLFSAFLFLLDLNKLNNELISNTSHKELWTDKCFFFFVALNEVMKSYTKRGNLTWLYKSFYTEGLTS